MLLHSFVVLIVLLGILLLVSIERVTVSNNGGWIGNPVYIIGRLEALNLNRKRTTQSPGT